MIMQDTNNNNDSENNEAINNSTNAVIKDTSVKSYSGNNDAINNLVEALNEIEEADFNINKVVLKEEEINIHKDGFTTYENNFTSKLSEGYVKKSDKIIEPKGLIRQLQIPKKYIYSEYNDPKIESGYKKILAELGDNSNNIKELNLIPDFIIHKSQDDNQLENQRLIVEVKTENNLSYKKFLWDFFKLNIYLEKYNFQTGCFLSVNMTKEKIDEHLSKYVKSGHFKTNHTQNLFIIIKEDHKHPETIFSLSDFIYMNGLKDY